MVFKELFKRYNSKKAKCAICGKTLISFGDEPLGLYFVLDKSGNFYCTDCDSEFEDGDNRIFDASEKPVEEYDIEELLIAINGIFDFAYECEYDENERIYICEVEAALHKYLKEKELIK